MNEYEMTILDSLSDDEHEEIMMCMEENGCDFYEALEIEGLI